MTRRLTAFFALTIAWTWSCDPAGEGARRPEVTHAADTVRLPFEELASHARKPTRVRMHGVHFHLPADIVLRIHDLDGEMRATVPGRPISFDDVESFELEAQRALISIGTGDLERLMNDWIFDYDGAPMRDIEITTKDSLLVQKGVLDGPIDARFEMTAMPELMPSGEIRLRPVNIRVLGIGARGLMNLLDIELDEVMDVSGAKGVRLEGNDLYIDPVTALPPPRMTGRMTSLRVRPGELVQVFGDVTADGAASRDTTDGNFMAFTGGLLAFGKLLMVDADMLVVDADPSDPFDFSIGEYRLQLVAGYSETLRDLGLRVRMPDLDELRAATALRRPRAR